VENRGEKWPDLSFIEGTSKLLEWKNVRQVISLGQETIVPYAHGQDLERRIQKLTLISEEEVAAGRRRIRVRRTAVGRVPFLVGGCAVDLGRFQVEVKLPETMVGPA